jgi:type II secretory pathway pseudopilin PulG
MRRSRAGFSLIEALLACALLAIVLAPVLGAFRAQLAAAARMQARLRLERAWRERLDEAEARVRAGVVDPLPSGRQPGGLVFRESPPEAVPCGPGQLWHLTIEAADPRERLVCSGTRRLILVPRDEPAGEAP